MSELVNNRSVEDIIALLSEPLDEDIIETRRGGGNQELSYIPVWRVIDQANRIFGFGGWSYEVLDTELVTNGTWKIYKARVQVTVPALNPSPSSDIGTTAIQTDTMDGHDMALKGAVSDGMRRVFRKYGEQFGNSLYNKKRGRPTYHTPSQQPVKPAQPVQNENGIVKASQKQIAAIYTISKNVLEMDEAAVKAKCMEFYKVGPADLAMASASDLIKLLTETKKWPERNTDQKASDTDRTGEKIPAAAAKELRIHINDLVKAGELDREKVTQYLKETMQIDSFDAMTIKQRAQFQAWVQEQTTAGPVGTAAL